MTEQFLHARLYGTNFRFAYSIRKLLMSSAEATLFEPKKMLPVAINWSRLFCSIHESIIIFGKLYRCNGLIFDETDVE